MQVRPPAFATGPLRHVHDEMYFGDSADSVGIQMADLCAYFIAKRLEEDFISEGFYRIIEKQVIVSAVEPRRC